MQMKNTISNKIKVGKWQTQGAFINWHLKKEKYKKKFKF